jgi:hypothetical protein
MQTVTLTQEQVSVLARLLETAHAPTKSLNLATGEWQETPVTEWPDFLFPLTGKGNTYTREDYSRDAKALSEVKTLVENLNNRTK